MRRLVKFFLAPRTFTTLRTVSMRYRVRGFTVRSENAAKPVTQPNPYVLKWIRELPQSASVLDFGCGKLRYTIPLADRVRHVTAVDSAVQLCRQQLLNGVRTNIKEYARSYLANARAVAVADPQWQT